MLYPSIKELSDEGVNRYALSIATAKAAREITDEQYIKSQKNAEAMRDDKFLGYKKFPPMEKPVKEAINRIYSRDFVIELPEDK